MCTHIHLPILFRSRGPIATPDCKIGHNTMRPGEPAIILHVSISSKPDRRGQCSPCHVLPTPPRQEYDDDNRPDSAARGAGGLWDVGGQGLGSRQVPGTRSLVLVIGTRGLRR